MLILEEGSILRRLWAYLVDQFILIIPVGIFGTMFPFPTRSEALFIVLSICFEQYLYFFLLTWLNKGRSLGQKLFKLQVMEERSKSNPGIRGASIHSIGKILYLIPLDLLIGVIFSKYYLEENISRFSQRLAHTKVVGV